MFATTISVLGVTLVGLSESKGEFNLGFGAPLIVDLVAWYIVGVYLGVLPSVA